MITKNIPDERHNILSWNRLEIERYFRESRDVVNPVIYVLGIDDPIAFAMAAATDKYEDYLKEFIKSCPTDMTPTVFLVMPFEKAVSELANRLSSGSSQRLNKNVYDQGMFYVVCVAAGGTTVMVMPRGNNATDNSPYIPVETPHHLMLKELHMAKVKQGYLEGTEPPSIGEIDEAAETYYSLNDKSWKLRGKVEEAREALLEVMKKNKLTVYEYENKIVSVTEKEIVKVKKRKAEDNGDE